jgi:FkbM family methyltransferase
MQTSSDPDVFDQIFHRRELNFLKHIKNPRVIIDAGANVGYVSAFCLSAYKRSFVLSVEPESTNHLQCTKNLRPYGNRSQLLRAAVWHTKGDLVLSRGTFGDGREWATEVREARDGEKGDVYAWDVPSLILMCPSPTIDLLKIDIEGSEAALFSRDVRWLDHVKNMCVELHGSACERAFRAATASYRFDELRCGEYTVCLNIQRV